MRIVAAILIVACATMAFAQQAPNPIEQRLAGVIASLMIENARLAVELDAARQTIAQLQQAQLPPKPEAGK